MVLKRPLVLALALVGVCIVAVVLVWLFDARLAGACIVATSAPAAVITAYEALRVLDTRDDEESCRAAVLALALLSVPVVTVLAIAMGVGESAIGRLFP